MGDDHGWLATAIELSRLCPPSRSAFNVGAVLVGADGRELARGYSRERDGNEHAEESALSKIDISGSGADRATLREATMYSSLEPCSTRRSRARPCARLIRDAGIRRVVFALREPPVFVHGAGAEWLAAAGITVVELDDLADLVREINRPQLTS